MRPVLGRPALLQKILLAMIADWTVLDQSFFLCKRNFPKLVVCAGKVQNADVLIHQKILAGMCVFLHLRLLSSTILLPKRYTKNRPRLYNETDLVRVAIQNFLKNPVISMVFGHPNRKISCISPPQKGDCFEAAALFLSLNPVCVFG